MTYFISPEKVTAEVETYLKERQIGIQKYDEVETYLNSFPGKNILIDPRKRIILSIRLLIRNVLFFVASRLSHY